MQVGKVITLFKVDATGLQYEVSSLEVDRLGIKEDKHYNKDEKRAILLSSLISYELAKTHGITMPQGSLYENILIDINPYHLSIGSKLNIGSTLFEVTQACTICGHLSTIDDTLPLLLKESRGVFIKALSHGNIKYHDKVVLL